MNDAPAPSIDATRAVVSIPLASALGGVLSPAGKRLARLFRVSLATGRIHPLYLPLVKYESAKVASA